jgi:hypothetical protein
MLKSHIEGLTFLALYGWPARKADNLNAICEPII